MTRQLAAGASLKARAIVKFIKSKIKAKALNRYWTNSINNKNNTLSGALNANSAVLLLNKEFFYFYFFKHTGKV